MGIKIGLLSIALLFVLAMAFVSGQPASQVKRLAAYGTGLADRTPNQRYNARRAARYIDGSVILPGTTFSFNTKVGGWASGNGYRRAPVSYNGVLVDEYGGGVCQTSTTVYNAALLAGMTIIERHSHTFAPGYVPAGRDAAVAYQNVDLRFKNPYNFPVVLHATTDDQFLLCSLTAEKLPADRISLQTKTLDIFPAPIATVEPGAGLRRSRWHIKGRDGVRVAVFRSFYNQSGTLLSSQLVSDNTYRGITAARWAVTQ